MREMGSVELLTREGEIEIAKRIEEGLKHMIMAISRLPDDGRADPRPRRRRSQKDELKIDELVDGLMDFNAKELRPARCQTRTATSEDERGRRSRRRRHRQREPRASSRSRALERFDRDPQARSTQMLVVLEKEGYKAPKLPRAAGARSSDELMQIRFTARDGREAVRHVRTEVDDIRQIERKIQDIVREQGRHAAPGLHQDVPRQRDHRCAGSTARSTAHHTVQRAARATYRQAIVEQQQKLLDLQTRVMHPA